MMATLGPCTCCCHIGIGTHTICEHCWPADPTLLDLTDDTPHAPDCRCESCRPDIIRLAPETGGNAGGGSRDGGGSP
jgi:hypothetical protein